MTISKNTILTALIGVIMMLFVITLSPVPAQAASTDATFTQLKGQLELLRANIMQMRSASTTKASSTRPVIDRTCMQEAVNTREGKITESFATYTSAITAAMNKRKDSFSTVWGTDGVTNNTKHKQIWSQWKQDLEAARKSSRASREAAWKTFRETAVSSCKAKLPKEEAATQDALI